MANELDFKKLVKGLPLTAKGFEELYEQLDKVVDLFIKGQKIFNDASKNQEDLAKKTNQVKKATEKVDEIEKERLKLLQQLKKANSTRIDQNEEIRVQLSEQKKTNKELAKEKLGLISAYQKESKRLVELKKRYKDLAVTNKTNTDSARELLAEITVLDGKLKDVDSSVGENTRHVGGYSEALSELGSPLQGVAGGIDGVGESGNALVGVFKSLIKNPILGFFALIGGALAGLFKMFKDSRAGGVLLAKSFTGISARVDIAKKGVREYTQRLTENIKEQGFFKTALQEFIKIQNPILNATDAQNKAYEEQVQALKKLKIELIDLNDAYIDIENELATQVVTQQGIAQVQAAIADDATRSLQERRKAAEAAREAEEKAALSALSLANERLIVSQKEIEIGIASGELLRQNDGTIKSLTQNGIELEKAFTDASIAAISASNELALSRIENQKRIREINQDDFEQELDFLLDIADAQKTVNEQRIADQTIAYNERVKILGDTKKLIEESFDDQLGLFNQELGIQLERNKLLELNNKDIFEYARGLELSEIATNRLREVIIERRKAVQDLNTAQKDLNKELFESVDEFISKIEEENKAFEESLQEGSEDTTKKIEEDEKRKLDAALKRIKEAEAAEKELFNFGVASANDLFALRSSFRDSEIEGIERQRDAEVAAAKESGQDTAVIEAKFAKKEADLRKKQAVQNKIQSAFNATLDIAAGAIKYASNPLTAPLLPAFLALGAIRLAAIAATPIPKFWKGVENFEGGAAIVGDKYGREIINMPGHAPVLSPDKATPVYLPKGTEVIPNFKTEKILQGSSGEEINILKSIDRKLSNTNSGNYTQPVMTPEGTEYWHAKKRLRQKYLGNRIK